MTVTSAQSFSLVKGNVTREALAAIPLPERTPTYEPVPHLRLVELAEDALKRNNLEIVSQRFEITRSGNQFFGIINAVNGTGSNEIIRSFGLRSSYDKTLPVGICFGAQILVCSNLCFRGEITYFRKHTVNVWNDLPPQLDGAVTRSKLAYEQTLNFFEGLKDISLDAKTVHDILVRSVFTGVIPSRWIKKVYDEYLDPRHDEFGGRTGWSLHNAYTEILKAANQTTLPERTIKLDRLLTWSLREPLVTRGIVSEADVPLDVDFEVTANSALEGEESPASVN